MKMLTARLVEWHADKGYGFLRVGSQRVFLHIRDFAERHKTPAVGDVIRFTMGADRQGRTCALRAVHANDGGRLTLATFASLLLLLALPVAALHRLGLHPGMTAVAALAVSAVTYLVYALDKSRARARDWRIPESALHLLALVGGWPGALLAQRHFRHKSAKLRFQIAFWLIVAAHQLAALDYLVDWKITRAIWAFFINLTAR